METLNNIIATNLRVAMAKENTNVTKVHLLTGVSRSSITSYRKGDMKQVDLVTITKLSEVLNIKPSDLFIEGDSDE